MHVVLIVLLVLGAGANHAIVDVLKLKQIVLSKLGPTAPDLRFDVGK